MKGQGEHPWINIYVNALNNAVVPAWSSFMTLIDGDTQILPNSFAGVRIHENSNRGFAITLRIEMRQFYVNIRTENSGSRLDVFIHNHGFGKIVHLQRQLVCLFLSWNRISRVGLK